MIFLSKTLFSQTHVILWERITTIVYLFYPCINGGPSTAVLFKGHTYPIEISDICITNCCPSISYSDLNTIVFKIFFDLVDAELIIMEDRCC